LLVLSEPFAALEDEPHGCALRFGLLMEPLPVPLMLPVDAPGVGSELLCAAAKPALPAISAALSKASAIFLRIIMVAPWFVTHWSANVVQGLKFLRHGF
jgi:hypothetical protein